MPTELFPLSALFTLFRHRICPSWVLLLKNPLRPVHKGLVTRPVGESLEMSGQWALCLISAVSQLPSWVMLWTILVLFGIPFRYHPTNQSATTRSITKIQSKQHQTHFTGITSSVTYLSCSLKDHPINKLFQLFQIWTCNPFGSAQFRLCNWHTLFRSAVLTTQ